MIIIIIIRPDSPYLVPNKRVLLTRLVRISVILPI